MAMHANRLAAQAAAAERSARDERLGQWRQELGVQLQRPPALAQPLPPQSEAYSPSQAFVPAQVRHAPCHTWSTVQRVHQGASTATFMWLLRTCRPAAVTVCSAACPHRLHKKACAPPRQPCADGSGVGRLKRA
jgi:hypothetical protein